MAVRRTLPPGGIVRRLATFMALILVFNNGTPISLLSLLRSDWIGFWTKVALGLTYFLLFLSLLRFAIDGLRPWGALAVSLIISVIYWLVRAYLFPFVDSFDTLVAVIEVMLIILLTVGNVSAYFARGITGQSPVLKNPP